MIQSKLPRRLAVVGIVVGFAFMGIWWYIDKYDPFRLPTWQQAQTMGNFSAPPWLRLIENLTFVLCPGSFLHLLTMDMGDSMTRLTWVLAALINGLIYFAVGVILAALMRGRRQMPAQ